MFVVVSIYYHHCIHLHRSSSAPMVRCLSRPAAEVSAALEWASFLCSAAACAHLLW